MIGGYVVLLADHPLPQFSVYFQVDPAGVDVTEPLENAGSTENVDSGFVNSEVESMSLQVSAQPTIQ